MSISLKFTSHPSYGYDEHSYASRVFVIHRRSELRACKEDLATAKANPKIHFLLDTEIVDAYGKDHLEGLTIVNNVTGEKRNMPVWVTITYLCNR